MNRPNERYPLGAQRKSGAVQTEGPIIKRSLALKFDTLACCRSGLYDKRFGIFPDNSRLRTGSRSTGKLESAMSIPSLARTATETVWGQSHRLFASERWYAVHTLPFAEARAEGQLHRQRFRTFQPKRHKTVRHARRLSTVEVPFFFPLSVHRTRSRPPSVAQCQRHVWRIAVGDGGRSATTVPHGVG
jgi:hypothetical protein